MRPITVPDCDDVVPNGAGEGMDLPVAVVDTDDYRIYVSTWELETEEKEMLAEGGHLALALAGLKPPQAVLRVVAPYCEKCGTLMEFNKRLRTYTCPEDDEKGGTDVG